MYKFIKIRHDIIKECHGNYKEMKKFNHKLEIGIFRNSTHKYLGVLRGSFEGFGCPKRHPDALLAKTMAGCKCISYFNAFCDGMKMIYVCVQMYLSHPLHPNVMTLNLKPCLNK